MRDRKALISRLMAGLETPDDLTPEEQDHQFEDLLNFLQEEHSKCEED
jgi:hypothetical protein